MRIGREGSTDHMIARLDERGVYVSVRTFGPYGFYLSFGPRYITKLGVRR